MFPGATIFSARVCPRRPLRNRPTRFKVAAVGAVAFIAASLNAADYQRDIRPILEERCYSCHSRLKQKADLRLDAGALIHKGGKNGQVVLSGKAGESPLLERVRSTDDDERMPPEGKPLTPEKIALLEEWIAAGATFPADELIPKTPAEHWSFQPVLRPAVPEIKIATSARNPIDNFVLAGLEQRGWQPTPTAEPRALLRRIYLDLTGLPPTPAEQDRFLKDASPQTLDAVIDDLLSRPTYGERWARHWLDVVRYADSNGYERDAEKPFVWRYRDYVINALNADKPFNQFVVEQLAGDEVAVPSAESMIATSYLRLGHWDDEPADPPTDRFDQLDDIVSTSSLAFLGLTLGCARCHDHKFEPLATRDYYSMVAVFNPLERPRDGRTEHAVPAGTRLELAALAERDRQIELLSKLEPKLPPDELGMRTNALRAATPDLPLAYAWREPPTNPPPSFVMLRGSASRPGDPVQPAVPAILVKQQPEFPFPDERTTHRRLGLATWLTDPGNPLTARVMVNRVWQQHFGQGLVRTPNDFGLMGELPTHPELLDWLTHWFVHDANWSLKKLHRLILTSNTWRMSTRSNPEYAAVDPENRLLWRLPNRRLQVEAIRDSMLAVSGQLNPKMFGPAMKPAIPAAAVEANTDKESSWKPSDPTEASRRTIYAYIKRGLVVPMLEVLDLADTVSSCPQRQVTTVAPQALSLFNGDFVNEQARHFASRLQREAGPGRREQIELAWRLALCRPPTSTEIAAMVKFCEQEASKLMSEALTEKRELTKAEAEKAALTQMCRVILNLNEFVYAE